LVLNLSLGVEACSLGLGLETQSLGLDLEAWNLEDCSLGLGYPSLDLITDYVIPTVLTHAILDA